MAVDAFIKELTLLNTAQLLSGSAVVINTFDTSAGRQVVKDYCASANLPCLHVGLASDDGEVIGKEVDRVPSPANDHICDYSLARNLLMLSVAVASEVVATFAATREQQSFTLKLGDFTLNPLEVSRDSSTSPL